MLSRQAGSSLVRLPIHSRLVLRPTTPSQFSCSQDLASRALIYSSIRHYATPGRPRKAVGEPSKPVKRAVKRQAKSTSKDDPATKLVKAKKAASKPKTQKAAPKKAAPKKATRKPKKVLTEKQKEAKVANKEKAHIKELRFLALEPPRGGRALSAFAAYVQEHSKGKSVGPMQIAMKQFSQDWKSVTPAQHEHYNHLATQITESNRAEYKRWVESHSPEQIKQANRARRELSKKIPSKSKRVRNIPRFRPINDERQPKQPIPSYLLFAKNRQESGDFKNITIPERARLIGKEWRALTLAEKQKYKDLEIEDKSRYSSEHKDAYGYMPLHLNSGLQAASASA